MPTDTSTTGIEEPALSTADRLPHAGGKLINYRKAWRKEEATTPVSTESSTQGISASPTGIEGSRAAALGAATDPVAEQAVGRPPEALPVRLRITERWDGVVVDSRPEEGFFIGRVVPLGREEPELFADFRLDKVDQQDLPLVQEGALFFAITGFIPVGPGQRIQASTLRFRRLARWRADDVQFMRASARKRRAALGLDEQD